MATTKQCLECKRFRMPEEFMRRWDQPEDEEIKVCIVCNVKKDMAEEKAKERNSTELAARKTCTKCKADKPTSEFNRRAKAEDGLQSWCRLCTVEAARAYNKKKRSKQKRSEAQKRRYAEAAKADPVNSPEHYKTGGIECIDAMIQVFGEDAVRTYARINAFKYQWRHRYKGKPEEDLAKAAWYTRFANGDDPRKEGKQ